MVRLASMPKARPPSPQRARSRKYRGPLSPTPRQFSAHVNSNRPNSTKQPTTEILLRALTRNLSYL